MATYYKAIFHRIKIESVEIEDETDCFVILNGRREAKNTDYHAYRKTHDAAKHALVMHWQGKVEAAQKQLRKLKDKLWQARQA